MKNQENATLNDLLAGIGVISNVMLLGQSTQKNFNEENPEVLKSLCHMTWAYADELYGVGEEVERTQTESVRELVQTVLDKDKKPAPNKATDYMSDEYIKNKGKKPA